MPLEAAPLPSDAPPLVGGTYDVSTVAQLEYMDAAVHQSQYLNSNIVLTNDINLENYPWVPIGSTDTPFSGTFNGQMHTITGLAVAGTGDSPVGLFGEVTGAIANVGVTGAVYGGGYVDTGILVGRLDVGQITDSFTTGTVSGGGNNGGMAGTTGPGTSISDSFSTANVTGIVDSSDGGLVGFGHGDISNCYATGIVTGGGSEGGLAGFMGGDLDSADELSNSYFSGTVLPLADQLGGSLVATDEGVISNSFFDNSIPKVGALPGVGQGNAQGFGTGEPTPTMQQESTFTSAGWDFSHTWGISPSINGGYPYLQAWAHSIVSSSVSDTASGQFVPVTAVVNYAGVALDHAAVTLSVPSGEGTWQDGSVTDSVYTQVYSSSIDTWIAPVVDTPTSITITAGVAGDPSLQTTVAITVEPPIPVAPTNLQHTGVTESGWTETWDAVPHAHSYHVYLNNMLVGSPVTPTYTFTNLHAATQYDVTVTAVNEVGQEGPTASETVTTDETSVVQPAPTPVPPQILTKSLQTATVGQPYSAQLAELDATSPFQWAIVNGSLPAGLTLDDNGLLSGTPTGVLGDYTITVRLTDGNHQTATQSLTLALIGSTLPPPPTHPTKPIYIPVFYAVFQGIRGENQYGPDSFDITSLGYGSGSGSTGMSGRTHGLYSLQSINFSKSEDSVTPQLMFYAATGKQFTGDFYKQKQVQGHYVRYFHLHFVGKIVSVTSAASSGAGPSDTIEIQPILEQVSGAEGQPSSSTGAKSPSGWDITSAEKK